MQIPKVRNFEPCDIVGTIEMFWIDMYFPFTNHSFENPLALRMMCGYEVSEKLAFVITKWSGEFVSKDKEILAMWKGIKCFKFLGALAMRDSPCRVIRRRVRKTAVSSATLIEEFDSFVGTWIFC
ncbi:hypothetical protein CMV_007888 [Castanea mollissima]|uniref:Uncharacterized protein n=1 Tax=Castanea mollissima TaxID=60419 RepID=A0A8J4RMI1_9ROSI|nr:hypothetical protein CMV_007888 [Castanea mollissima]